MRIRSRSHADRGGGRQAPVGGGPLARRSNRVRLARRRFELLQPAWAAPRRWPRDPRAHPPADPLPEDPCAERCAAGVVMAKLYTRAGDAGETGLLGPARVSKDDPRVEAMGAVDELNAVIGLTLAAQKENRIRDLLLKIQDDLFTVGAELAMVPGTAGAKGPPVTHQHVARLQAGVGGVDVGGGTEIILPPGSRRP